MACIIRNFGVIIAEPSRESRRSGDHETAVPSYLGNNKKLYEMYYLRQEKTKITEA